jgi:hypothetical protein
MLITHTGNCVVFEPETDAELSAWQPSGIASFQMVKHAQHEYWIYFGGQFIGCATRLRHEEAWQAVSGSQAWCVAPLPSLEECGRRLLARQESELLPV